MNLTWTVYPRTLLSLNLLVALCACLFRLIGAVRCCSSAAVHAPQKLVPATQAPADALQQLIYDPTPAPTKIPRYIISMRQHESNHPIIGDGKRTSPGRSVRGRSSIWIFTS
jgi:hypothetical protein